MNIERSLLNRIRGWLPKEPVLSNCQASANSTFQVFVHWMAIAVVVGSIGGALLGVAGDLFGLDRALHLAWPITTGSSSAWRRAFRCLHARKQGLGRKIKCMNVEKTHQGWFHRINPKDNPGKNM
jgi:hypothetical protein